ncbi:MAG: alpha/beta hydrolase [Planctomycetota bacterium]
MDESFGADEMSEAAPWEEAGFENIAAAESAPPGLGPTFDGTPAPSAPWNATGSAGVPPAAPRWNAPQSLSPHRSKFSLDPPSSAAETAGSEVASVGTTGKFPEPLDDLPAGSTFEKEDGFAKIQVFYATDRRQGPLSLSSFELTGQRFMLTTLTAFGTGMFVFAGLCQWRRRLRLSAVSSVGGLACMGIAIGIIGSGGATIQKHGVTYGSERGLLQRGICHVTVPARHERGVVERPSLLRFEFREDQQKHIVMTRVLEMTRDRFLDQLSQTVDSAPDRDLLLFIHGYNVDFESAVQRTAQLAVDLPFEGVPVCYSWPSQASLLGYTIDENNAQWTAANLKEFLMELAQESGASSINVVAHSMGNRPMTTAMQQIRFSHQDKGPLFDRIVLAAPDVDADHFRRDLAQPLRDLSNQVTLYASSDDQALIASKKVHGHPRAGESGDQIVVVPGVETVDVSGIDLSLLGHSYYGDNPSMLKDLHEVVRERIPAHQRGSLISRQSGALRYWKLATKPTQPVAW